MAKAKSMNYPFENLTPEKFQQFCQALLAHEYPNLQCFPVAQPDGGRDAVQWLAASPRTGFVVFQVKYVRAPMAEREPHKWLSGIIVDELPKVEKLIPRGAKQYVLLLECHDIGYTQKCHDIGYTLSSGRIEWGYERSPKGDCSSPIQFCAPVTAGDSRIGLSWFQQCLHSIPASLRRQLQQRIHMSLLAAA